MPEQCVRGTVLLTHSQRSPLRDDAKSGEPETVIGEDISDRPAVRSDMLLLRAGAFLFQYDSSLIVLLNSSFPDKLESISRNSSLQIKDTQRQLRGQEEAPHQHPR